MSKQQFTTEAAGPVAVTVVVSTRNRRYKIEPCARALAALRCGGGAVRDHRQRLERRDA